MNLDFEDKFRTIIKKMAEVGNEYAEAKGQSWQMQELKGSILATLINKQGSSVSVAQRETIAKGSEDFQTYIRETSDAIKKELKLKSEYEKWKASFEALRSLSSLEKKTMDTIGG